MNMTEASSSKDKTVTMDDNKAPVTMHAKKLRPRSIRSSRKDQEVESTNIFYNNAPRSPPRLANNNNNSSTTFENLTKTNTSIPALLSSNETESSILNNIGIVFGIVISSVLIITIIIICLIKRRQRNKNELPTYTDTKEKSSLLSILFSKKTKNKHHEIDNSTIGEDEIGSPIRIKLNSTTFSSNSSTSSLLSSTIEKDSANSFNIALEKAIEEDKQVLEYGGNVIRKKIIKFPKEYDVKRTSSYNKRLAFITTSKEEDVETKVVWVSDEDTKSGILNTMEEAIDFNFQKVDDITNNTIIVVPDKGTLVKLENKDESILASELLRMIQYDSESLSLGKTTITTINKEANDAENSNSCNEADLNESNCFENDIDNFNIPSDEAGFHSASTTFHKMNNSYVEVDDVYEPSTSSSSSNNYGESSVTPDITSYYSSTSDRNASSSVTPDITSSSSKNIPSVSCSSLTNSNTYHSSSSISSYQIFKLPKSIKVKTPSPKKHDSEEELEAIIQDEIMLLYDEHPKTTIVPNLQLPHISSPNTTTTASSKSNYTNDSTIEGFLEKEMETFFEENITITRSNSGSADDKFTYITPTTSSSTPSSIARQQPNIYVQKNVSPVVLAKQVRFKIESSPSFKQKLIQVQQQQTSKISPSISPPKQQQEQFNKKQTNVSQPLKQKDIKNKIREKIKLIKKQNELNATLSTSSSSFSGEDLIEDFNAATQNNVQKTAKESKSIDSSLSSKRKLSRSPKITRKKKRIVTTRTTKKQRRPSNKLHFIKPNSSSSDSCNSYSFQKPFYTMKTNDVHQDINYVFQVLNTTYSSSSYSDKSEKIDSNMTNAKDDKSFIKSHEVMSWLFETDDNFRNNITTANIKPKDTTFENFNQKQNEQQLDDRLKHFSFIKKEEED